MSRRTEIVDSVNLDAALGRTLNEFARKNVALTGAKLQDMPRRFRNASIGFYFSVLKVRTGRLRQSFKEFARPVGEDSMEYGMRSDVEYARIQHEGGHTPPHVIEPKNKKALYWAGAAHPYKRVNHPGSRITAKKYFSTPMTTVVNEVIAELKKELDW